MVRSTFFGIQIGTAGLQTSQLGLDVTAHNIANAETKGFTRQRIISTAVDPYAIIGRALPTGAARVGTGVRVKIHDQIRSEYLDRRFRTENTTNAYWQTRTQELRYLESFFDSVNEETSINFTIARFFGAVKDMSVETVENAPRTQLQDAGQDLVQSLNLIYDGLIDLQNSQNLAVATKVDDINRIAIELVEINKAIYIFEVTGHVANDLRDKRNLLIDELSTIIDVEYRETADPKGNTIFEVSIGGQVLVKHDERAELAVREEDNVIDGEERVNVAYWVDKPEGRWIDEIVGSPDLDMTRIRGGELKALMDMRDGTGDYMLNTTKGIPYYIEMINSLARALVQEVNEVHRQGWTNHPVHGSRTGINFFHEYTDISEITAKNIRLSDEVQESAFNIAASSVEILRGTDSNGAPIYLQQGNNENMNALYTVFSELKNIVVQGVIIGSLDSYATSIRTDVGNTLRMSDSAARNSDTLTLAMEYQRTSISGVSLDEEMTNLIRYQHAYSGAARVITAMDDALDRLINGTGRVGL